MVRNCKVAKVCLTDLELHRFGVSAVTSFDLNVYVHQLNDQGRVEKKEKTMAVQPTHTLRQARRSGQQPLLGHYELWLAHLGRRFL